MFVFSHRYADSPHPWCIEGSCVLIPDSSRVYVCGGCRSRGGRTNVLFFVRQYCTPKIRPETKNIVEHRTQTTLMVAPASMAIPPVPRSPLLRSSFFFEQNKALIKLAVQ